MKSLRLLLLCCFVAFTVIPTVSQNATEPRVPIADPRGRENAEQVAKILGLSQFMGELRLEQAHSPCGAARSAAELSMRQVIFETIVAGSFDVDGVLAEMANERAQLSDLREALQSRRDRATNLANTANLVTGTGVGIAVNALQFSDSTANVGNGLGVASGAASTALSIVGIRLQHGPQGSVGRVPNMLAPLFGKPAVLNSYYPETVLAYLRSVPAGESAADGSRLDQLMAAWRKAGRLGPVTAAATGQKITVLTTSLNPNVKISIGDLTDRMTMLADAEGRVALMKRDLANLLRSLRADGSCEVK